MEAETETRSEIGELTHLTGQLAIAGEWYEDEKRDYPPVFTAKTLRTFPEIGVNEKGEKIYHWHNGSHTEEEWEEKWIRQFPNIKRADGSTPHETLRFRTQQTTDKKIIDNAWADLGKTSISCPSDWSSKVKNFMEKFKCDMYGNVISIDADNNALTKFDIDHIFPWSRGGRSRRANFAAVQCVANRSVKNDTILQLLDPDEMRCGLQVDQLISLIDFTKKQADAIGKGRSNLSAELSQVESWLLHTPYKGIGWTNFQKMVKGTSSGSELYVFFTRRHINLLETNLNLIERQMGRVSDHNESAKGGAIIPTKPSKVGGANLKAVPTTPVTADDAASEKTVVVLGPETTKPSVNLFPTEPSSVRDGNLKAVALPTTPVTADDAASEKTVVVLGPEPTRPSSFPNVHSVERYRLPERLKEHSLPCINLIINPGACIECYNSYAIHNELRDELLMSWDWKRKCWVKICNEDLTPIVEAIKIMAINQDCDIKITTITPEMDPTPIKSVDDKAAEAKASAGHNKDGSDCKNCAKSPTHFCERHKDQNKETK